VKTLFLHNFSFAVAPTAKEKSCVADLQLLGSFAFEHKKIPIKKLSGIILIVFFKQYKRNICLLLHGFLFKIGC